MAYDLKHLFSVRLVETRSGNVQEEERFHSHSMFAHKNVPLTGEISAILCESFLYLITAKVKMETEMCRKVTDC